MRRSECRHDIHTNGFQVGPAEHRHHLESHEARLAKGVDLFYITRVERLDAVTTPISESFMKPLGVLCERDRIELIAP
jgi:hypothetical protein